MKVMIFVLDNLISDKELNNNILKLYENWNYMYLMSRYEEFCETDLYNFEVLNIF
jgi:hypothetical protein